MCGGELYRMARKAIQLCEVISIGLLLCVGIKVCGRVADKFGLRTWMINLRAWIFGFTCLVFKSTCIDRKTPLREGAFFFTGRTFFPPLDKRNTCDNAKGLRITSERRIGELGVRRLSTLNRGQDSAATVSYRWRLRPILLREVNYIGQRGNLYSLAG